MKRLVISAIVVLLILSVGQLSAQNGFLASQFFLDSTPGPLSSCPAPAVGHDKLCDVTGVGYEQSINGGAYSPLTIVAPVTSVNGKVGAVVISASTTSTTTVQ